MSEFSKLESSTVIHIFRIKNCYIMGSWLRLITFILLFFFLFIFHTLKVRVTVGTETIQAKIFKLLIHKINKDHLHAFFLILTSFSVFSETL